MLYIFTKASGKNQQALRMTKLNNIINLTRRNKMNTVNAVNKHQARWPKGYVMAIIQDGAEVTYIEFMQCVDDMTVNKGE